MRRRDLEQPLPRRPNRNDGIHRNSPTRCSLRDFVTIIFILNCKNTESSPIQILLIYIYIYIHTHLLTPWCRVLPEQLTGLQLVKKFPEFHGTRRFITALTSVRHLSLSWASPIQSIYPHLTSWRSILILSTHLLLTYLLHCAESFLSS